MGCEGVEGEGSEEVGKCEDCVMGREMELEERGWIPLPATPEPITGDEGCD